MTDANTQPPVSPPADPPKPSPAPAPAVDVSALTTELAQSKQQLTKLQTDLAAAIAEKEATAQALAAAAQQQQQFQAQFGTLQTQLGEITQLKGTLEQQVTQLTGQATNLDGTNKQLSRQLAMINHIAADPALLAQAPRLLPLLGTLAIPEDPEAQKHTLQLWATTLSTVQSAATTEFRQGATTPAAGPAQPATGGVFQIPGQPAGGQKPLTLNEIAAQMVNVAGMDDKTYEALANQYATLQSGATKTEN